MVHLVKELHSSNEHVQGRSHSYRKMQVVVIEVGKEKPCSTKEAVSQNRLLERYAS